MTEETETVAPRQYPDDGNWDVDNEGRPGLAAAICAILTLLSTCSFRPDEIAGETAPIAFMLGQTVGVALFFWGIAFAITIRKASPGWIFGSLGIALGAGLIAFLINIGSMATDAQEQRADTTVDQVSDTLDYIRDGEFHRQLPTDDTIEPTPRLLNAMMNSVNADDQAFLEEATEIGLIDFLNFEGVTPQSAIFQNCDAIGSLHDRANYYRGRMSHHLAVTRRFGENMVRNRDISMADLDAFMAGTDEGRAGFLRNWEVNGLVAQEAAAACQVLARSDWELDGNGMPLFATQEQADAFNRSMVQIAAYQQEVQRRIDTVTSEIESTMESAR